jgi:hypothetical protein
MLGEPVQWALSMVYARSSCLAAKKSDIYAKFKTQWKVTNC